MPEKFNLGDIFTVDNICYKISSLSPQEVEVSKNAERYSGYIAIPESVLYEGSLFAVTKIGKNAFYDSRVLISVTIPDSVMDIGEETFKFCEHLTSVTIPNSITKIGKNAFCRCKSLASITIPNSVTEIGNSAFNWCCELTSINIPDSVTHIGKNAFVKCLNLKSIEVDNNNSYYTSIDAVLFNKAATTLIAYPNRKETTNYKIPNTVKGIGNGAFYGCKSLTSIAIPDSVTEIGERAFEFCDHLTSITIPTSVTKIGESAFKYCSSLENIISHIKENIDKILQGDSVFYANWSEVKTLYVPEDKVSAYKDSKWKEYSENIVPI